MIVPLKNVYIAWRLLWRARPLRTGCPTSSRNQSWSGLPPGPSSSVNGSGSSPQSTPSSASRTSSSKPPRTREEKTNLDGGMTSRLKRTSLDEKTSRNRGQILDERTSLARMILDERTTRWIVDFTPRTSASWTDSRYKHLKTVLQLNKANVLVIYI